MQAKDGTKEKREKNEAKVQKGKREKEKIVGNREKRKEGKTKISFNPSCRGHDLDQRAGKGVHQFCSSLSARQQKKRKKYSWQYRRMAKEASLAQRLGQV